MPPRDARPKPPRQGDPNRVDGRKDRSERRPEDKDHRRPAPDGKFERGERPGNGTNGRDRASDRNRDDRNRDDGHSDRKRPDKDRALDFSVPIPGVNGRIIIRDNGNVTVRSDDDARFGGRHRDRDVRRLSGGRTETIVKRRNGSAVITVRDRDGDILRRVRRTPDGREIILIDNDRPRRDERPLRFRPLHIDIPRDRYIVEGGVGRRPLVEEALGAPPVEPVERPYSLQEIRHSERLRAKMRRVDLSVTFAFDSAAIPRDQYDQIQVIGTAIEDDLARNPSDVFLIEGHTDAPGSYDYNLKLSDARAESVAIALSDYFGIPPENLVTQGYGEEYLKIDTLQREERNRRVTIRRITPLLEGRR